MKISFRALAIVCSFFMFVNACDTKTPEVTNEKLESPSVDHAKFTSNCAECHEPDRQKKGPNVDKETVEHGFGLDCVQCHAYPNFTLFPDRIKLHNPPPAKCQGCHSIAIEKARHEKDPNNPLFPDPVTHGPIFGECAACHTWPQWKASGGMTTTPAPAPTPTP